MIISHVNSIDYVREWSQATYEKLSRVALLARDHFLAFYHSASGAIDRYTPPFLKWSFHQIGSTASFCVQESRRFLWNHRLVILALTVAAAAAWKLYERWKSRLCHPTATLSSSLNKAVLEIVTPKIENQVNVSLTFCIDTSSSMGDEGRLQAIKSSLKTILDNAQRAVNGSESKIRLGIVAFNGSARLVTDITAIAKNGNVASIQQQVESLQPSGGTSILAGLQLADKLFQRMQQGAFASHYVVLLTDGEDQIHSVSQNFKGAHFFAIGIGQRHNKETLQTIASATGGQYYDTTKAGCTIEGTIQKIYQQALAHYQNIRLSTQQLSAGQWSIGNVKSSPCPQGGSICNIQDMTAGKKHRHLITLHPDQFSKPFDMSELSFQLETNCPNGTTSSIYLPWNPNTVINPAIFLIRY